MASNQKKRKKLRNYEYSSSEEEDEQNNEYSIQDLQTTTAPPAGGVNDTLTWTQNLRTDAIAATPARKKRRTEQRHQIAMQAIQNDKAKKLASASASASSATETAARTPSTPSIAAARMTTTPKTTPRRASLGQNRRTTRSSTTTSHTSSRSRSSNSASRDRTLRSSMDHRMNENEAATAEAVPAFNRTTTMATPTAFLTSSTSSKISTVTSSSTQQHHQQQQPPSVSKTRKEQRAIQRALAEAAVQKLMRKAPIPPIQGPQTTAVPVPVPQVPAAVPAPAPAPSQRVPQLYSYKPPPHHASTTTTMMVNDDKAPAPVPVPAPTPVPAPIPAPAPSQLAETTTTTTTVMGEEEAPPPTQASGSCRVRRVLVGIVCMIMMMMPQQWMSESSLELDPNLNQHEPQQQQQQKTLLSLSPVPLCRQPAICSNENGWIVSCESPLWERSPPLLLSSSHSNASSTVSNTDNDNNNAICILSPTAHALVHKMALMLEDWSVQSTCACGISSSCWWSDYRSRRSRRHKDLFNTRLYPLEDIMTHELQLLPVVQNNNHSRRGGGGGGGDNDIDNHENNAVENENDDASTSAFLRADRMDTSQILYMLTHIPSGPNGRPLSIWKDVTTTATDSGSTDDQVGTTLWIGLPPNQRHHLPWKCRAGMLPVVLWNLMMDGIWKVLYFVFTYLVYVIWELLRIGVHVLYTSFKTNFWTTLGVSYALKHGWKRYDRCMLERDALRAAEMARQVLKQEASLSLSSASTSAPRKYILNFALRDKVREQLKIMYDSHHGGSRYYRYFYFLRGVSSSSRFNQQVWPLALPQLESDQRIGLRMIHNNQRAMEWIGPLFIQ